MLFSTRLLSLPLALGYPASYNNIDCSGLISTPTYGLKDANFSICATIHIKAPVHKVCNVILDFHRYKDWNTFVYDAIPPDGVDGPEDVRLGMNIQFSSTGIPPGQNSTATDIITFVERPFFAAWKNIEFEEFIGHSEHCLLFLPLPNGYTRFTHWQTQLGANGRTLYPVKADFQREFEFEARDLKTYVESMS
ncbi:hypothetical protein K469DRAFT_600410 [Zopfia rhizophila CBS 207.26]|uniref:Uncharacterized protein n=1 Tax=Zopfia rhizophila CBS 207.26 TaxID=1314779 RepID=A0A6A6DJQ6_9PEZI|nr:hypothetical protein K469DRAFT_600410 [Zopfia rhizophila CBS 207.26]